MFKEDYIEAEAKNLKVFRINANLAVMQIFNLKEID